MRRAETPDPEKEKGKEKESEKEKEKTSFVVEGSLKVMQGQAHDTESPQMQHDLGGESSRGVTGRAFWLQPAHASVRPTRVSVNTFTGVNG